MYPKALTIAGSDPSGGAGIQADLATFHSLGVFGMSVLTALTAQNTRAVTGIFEISPQFIAQQLDAVLVDIRPGAVKTGMIFSPDIIQVVAQKLAEFKINHLVVDPVMISTTGYKLFREQALNALKESLFPLALFVTPNLDEAKVITQLPQISDITDMQQAARLIHKLGSQFVIVKGGHLPDKNKSVDVMYDGNEFKMLETPLLRVGKVHGTGCTFSAALTAFLALGYKPAAAAQKAKQYVFNGIKSAFKPGKGIAVANNLWAVDPKNQR